MRSLIVTLICLSLGLGCGGSDMHKAKRPKTAPASGVLTRKGTPLGGVLITFVPEAKDGIAASAMTGEDGSFDMQAFAPDSGAVPGKYTAIVWKNEPAAPAGPADSHDTPPPKPKKKGSSDIPEKYAKAETSSLLINLPEEGRTDFKIDIKD
jgi:hypothetical protein